MQQGCKYKEYKLNNYTSVPSFFCINLHILYLLSKKPLRIVYYEEKS